MIREPLAIPLREARAPLVIAVDVGTSGLRAFAFDARARPIASAIAHADRLPRTTRDGEVTLDADERARAAMACLDLVVRALGRRARDVAAVGVTTFWHSLVGLDARDRPTTPLITWADTRPRDAAASLRAELDALETHARTGCMIHASYYPAKLRWLRETDPEAFRATTHWVSFGEYVYLRIFGELRAAHGMASATGVYDQRLHAWDVSLLAHLGVPVGALSPIADAALMRPRSRYRSRWPALAGVPWLPAIGDGASSNVGAGAVGEGTAALMVGTSGAIRVIREVAAPPAIRGGWAYRLDERRAVVGGALSNAGNVLNWIAQTLPQVDVDRVLRSRAVNDGVVALPLLAGDRSPSWDDAARASLAGIGLGTRPEDLARALLEGVAHRFALLWELVDRALPGVRTIVATGGTALAHPPLLQLLADALGQPLVASAAGEGSARGAAIVALERIGALRDIAAAPSPRGRTFRPRPRETERLRAARERQARLERALRGMAS